MSALQNIHAPIALPVLVCNNKPASNLIRFSLLALTILACLFSATFAAIGILVERRLEDQMDDFQHVALLLNIFSSAFFAIVCGLGLFSCIAKRRAVASIFTSLVIGQILFSLIFGILYLYMLFNTVNITSTAPPSPSHVELRSVSDEFIRTLSDNMPIVRGVATTMFVVVWLVQIATILLGNVFLGQLNKEAAARGEYNPKYDLDDDC